jgi:hypothetical protein
MASLANQTISSTYDGLIKTSTDQPVGVSGVQLLEDGVGNTLALSVGRANQGVTVTGTLTATTLYQVLLLLHFGSCRRCYSDYSIFRRQLN